MRKLFSAKNAALFLLIVYSVDILWKLLHWREVFGRLPWWGVTLLLPFRFALMLWFLWLYREARRSRTPKALGS
jgi:hypothetical protein